MKTIDVVTFDDIKELIKVEKTADLGLPSDLDLSVIHTNAIERVASLILGRLGYEVPENEPEDSEEWTYSTYCVLSHSYIIHTVKPGT